MAKNSHIVTMTCNIGRVGIFALSQVGNPALVTANPKSVRSIGTYELVLNFIQSDWRKRTARQSRFDADLILYPAGGIHVLYSECLYIMA